MSDMKPRDPVKEAREPKEAAAIAKERKATATFLTVKAGEFRDRANTLASGNSILKKRLETLASDIEKPVDSSLDDL